MIHEKFLTLKHRAEQLNLPLTGNFAAANEQIKNVLKTFDNYEKILKMAGNIPPEISESLVNTLKMLEEFIAACENMNTNNAGTIIASLANAHKQFSTLEPTLKKLQIQVKNKRRM